MSLSATTTMFAGPSVCALCAGKLSGRFCSPVSSGGPAKADFRSPRTRAAITRGVLSGRNSANTLVGSGVFTLSTDKIADRALLDSSGTNSIAALSALRSDPAEATVTCCKSAVAGSSWFSPSRILNQAT